ncbi:unnamed protein product [Calypogeia fissa]
MRIMIKGGVWKNTEDEILKAAVMKYGKNQWARISSLLVRKSAKQCKARWYEWLDPSIKKTEWTREEDEKLLHLAKLMPTQWRTIAPIVGRTPAQCLERYEKLLDAACAKEQNYEPADDPRKLRPGEIDPNPESKPARPDPVDMDEDEKEMLSEARARLANTRGKKAKRKAREKQLEEARRLASLQKRRELKAAGIDARHRRRKQKGIDYNAEIPFEMRPLPGFFEVSQETRPVEELQFPTSIEELEGRRRLDVENQLRKQDVARNKIAQRRDVLAAVTQVNRLNDPEAVHKRAQLRLPAPQISVWELEEIAKMGYVNDLASGEGHGEGNIATSALVTDYQKTPVRAGLPQGTTPHRTPGGKGDAIMMEAENLARLRATQTPLYGGANPDLHPSDFSSITPKRKDLMTPNPNATPSRTPFGGTPSKDTASITLKGRPIRDMLNINEGMETPISAEKSRQDEYKRHLRTGLQNLPTAKNEYQILVPELSPEKAESLGAMEEDASDLISGIDVAEADMAVGYMSSSSKELLRDMPRPPSASVELLKDSLMSSGGFGTVLEQADELIMKELVRLLEFETVTSSGSEESSQLEIKKSAKGTASGRRATESIKAFEFPKEFLLEAAELIREELEEVRTVMGHQNATVDDYVEAHDSCVEDMVYFPARKSYGLASVASAFDRLAALNYEWENIRRHMDGETRKAVRLEQKLKVLTQGYKVREDNLWRQVDMSLEEANTLGTELECFRALHRQEQVAAPRRIEVLQDLVSLLNEHGRALQSQYEHLLLEKHNLKDIILETDMATAANGREEKLAIENDLVDKRAQGHVSATPREEIEAESAQVTALELTAGS